MKYLKSGILTLLIAFLGSFPTFHTNVCYGDNPSSEIVDDVYSSVVLITHKKIKTSIWDALYFASYFIVGVGNPIPVHGEKSGGTGFQTKWGVVTNSHVMDDMPKAVLTTFHRRSYRIKNINRIKCKDQHIPMYEAKMIHATPKEAITYDWGDIGIDLALIRLKMPMAVELPLAKEVKTGEKVFTLGHPDWKKFTPAIGSVNRMYNRGRTKYIELFIEGAPGSSGSPVLNMNGEVVGIIRGVSRELDVAEAVHVEELHKVFGLPIYNMPKKKISPAINSWSGPVYSTEYSRLFHHPECGELISKGGDLIEFPSKEVAIRDGGKPCPECNP